MDKISLLTKIEMPQIIGKVDLGIIKEKPHKKQHKSKKLAAEHAMKLKLKSPERTYGIYFCKKCSSYHVTSHGKGDKKYQKFLK